MIELKFTSNSKFGSLNNLNLDMSDLYLNPPLKLFLRSLVPKSKSSTRSVMS